MQSISWTEKYRPNTLNQIAGQQRILNSLRNFAKKSNVPHMIFTGPAGTGKTSAVHSFINDFVREYTRGDAPIREQIFERNASDEMLMKNLVELKNFVSHQTETYPCPFKFVILDESDHLTQDLQRALRRIIEKAPINTKFFFLNNYIENIIDPLLSRCSIFRFYPVPLADAMQTISNILQQESCTFNNEAIQIIYRIYHGDVRATINAIQFISSMKIQAHEIERILSFFGVWSTTKIQTYFDAIKNQCNIPNITEVSPRYFLEQVMFYVLNGSFTSKQKQQMIDAIALIDERITKGANENIQLNAITGMLLNIMEGKNYDT